MDPDFKKQLDKLLDIANSPVRPSRPGYIPYDQIVSGAAFLSDDMRKRYADLLRERGMDMMMAYPGEPIDLMGYYNPTERTVERDLSGFGYNVRSIPPDAVNLIGKGIFYPYVAGHELTHYASRGAERENQDFEDLSEKETRYLTAYNAPTKETFINSLKSMDSRLKRKGSVSETDISDAVHFLENHFRRHPIPPILVNSNSYARTRNLSANQKPFARMWQGLLGKEYPEDKLKDM